MKIWRIIKDAVWFIMNSRRFTNETYFDMLFSDHLLARTRLFCILMEKERL